MDLRPFAVNDGNEVWVLPGGLTRVALVEVPNWSNSSQAAAPGHLGAIYCLSAPPAGWSATGIVRSLPQPLCINGGRDRV